MKAHFQKLFEEILPDYAVEKKDMIDEGVSVLYNTISSMIQKESVRDGEEYKAVVNRIYDMNLGPESHILSGYDIDVFRYVDQHGTEALYGELEEEYKEAEEFIPTRFREFESRSRADYYKVKNNFYFLFHMAETIKKEFYNHIGTLRIALSSQEVTESATTWIPVDKWKLSGYTEKGLEIIKEFPAVYFSIYEIGLLLKGDIYGIIHRFMEKMYEEDRLEEYSIIKLTGQSCKIDLFRDALKEFVPGKTIQFKRRSGDLTKDFELKMTCVDGTLKYLKDRKYKSTRISMRNTEPISCRRIRII